MESDRSSQSPVKIADVAAAAGVSIGTVSKAVNGRGQLRAETRERVLATAAKLGFQPNTLARGLLSGRTFTVGMVTTDNFGRFSMPVLLGVEDVLAAGQMSVFLCDSRGDAIREEHYLRTMVSRRVDGIIVAGRRTEPRSPVRLDARVPVIYAMSPSTDPADRSVVVDDADGARLAVEHLIATGRTRIGHISGPQRHYSARVRADSTAQVLDEAGLSLAGGRIHYGEWTEEWGRQAGHILLRSEPDLDALFCANDQIARGAADILREAGRRVPEDVALVGYDNWDVMVSASRPPLTSVDMNLEELGRAAGAELLAAIDGRPSTGIRSIPCRLVIRESTGVSVSGRRPA